MLVKVGSRNTHPKNQTPPPQKKPNRSGFFLLQFQRKSFYFIPFTIISWISKIKNVGLFSSVFFFFKLYRLYGQFYHFFSWLLNIRSPDLRKNRIIKRFILNPKLNLIKKKCYPIKPKRKSLFFLFFFFLNPGFCQPWWYACILYRYHIDMRK